MTKYTYQIQLLFQMSVHDKERHLEMIGGIEICTPFQRVVV